VIIVFRSDEDEENENSHVLALINFCECGSATSVSMRVLSRYMRAES